MQPRRPFEEQLAQSWPPAAWQDLGVVLAVSGGADSVALARGMAALKAGGAGRLTVAHFNHGLRGAESDADAYFVCRLAGELRLDCISGNAEAGLADTGGEGLEARARAARYEFLQQVAQRAGARYVATAHTADDQAETVLHHVMRGTGIAGLAGMRRARPLGQAVTLIRPLLAVKRTDVLDYLTTLAQHYREDATNHDLAFTRNRIRRELLPQLARDYSPAIVDALVRLARLAGDAQRVVEAAGEELAERATVERSAARVVVDGQMLAAADRHLAREALLSIWRRQDWPLQDMGFAEWDLLVDMAPGAGGKRVLPGAIVAEARNGRLTLART